MPKSMLIVFLSPVVHAAALSSMARVQTLAGVSISNDISLPSSEFIRSGAREAPAEISDAGIGKVLAWAEEISTAVSAVAFVSAVKRIRGDPSSAVDVLFDLASSAREVADGIDRDAQIYHHLLMLLLEERRRKFSLFKQLRAAELVEDLARDYGNITDFRQMRDDELEQIVLHTRGSRHGLADIAAYYQGLARLGKMGKSTKNALIFTCSFGGGHLTAASAVQSYLNSAGFAAEFVDTTYDAEFDDLLVRQSAKTFNEIILKRQLYSAHNAADKMKQLFGPLEAPCPSPVCDSDRKDQFRTSILRRRPDLLITVYHMELLPILGLAKELGNLPLLHIATDLDIKMQEIFNSRMYPVYPRFLTGVPFNIEKSFETVSPLDRQHTFLSGYPVRAEFLEPVDFALVGKEREKLAPPGVKILLVMTGGGGQDIPWPYELAKEGIGEPLHMIVIAGGNTGLVESLRIELSSNITFPDGRTVWQGADSSTTLEVARDPGEDDTENRYYVSSGRLALLMDAADAILTKPGGGSTAEVAYRGIPAIFDKTHALFHWEEFTVEIFEEQGRGVSFTDRASLRPALQRALKLGRSTRLAESADGNILMTGERIAGAAKRVLEADCVKCDVFSSLSPLR